MKKFLAVFFSLIMAICLCGFATMSFADGEEKEELTISSLNYDNFYGAGYATYVFLGSIGEGWIEIDKTYLSYTDSEGVSQIGRVTSYAGNLAINFQSERANAEGDILVFKKGFTWDNKEVKKDITFKYTNNAWALQIEEKEDLTFTSVAYVTGIGGWHAGTVVVFNKTCTLGDWADGSVDKAHITFTNSLGNSKLDRVTTGDGNLIVNFDYTMANAATVAPVEGDILTFKQGFTWEGLTLDEDVAYVYTSGAWVLKTEEPIQKEDLTFTSVAYVTGISGWHAGTIVVFNKTCTLGDWADTLVDKAHITFTNALGNSKLDRVTTGDGNLIVNFDYTMASTATVAPVEGDILTFKQGFTWEGLTLDEDVAYVYTSGAWVLQSEVPEIKEALILNGFEFQSNFLGAYNSTFTYFSENILSADWQDAQFDKSYFTYVNANGENKLGRITNTSTYLCINFAEEAPAEGDVLTVKKGLVILNKELKEDVSYVYKNGAWVDTKELVTEMTFGNIIDVSSSFIVEMTCKDEMTTAYDFMGFGGGYYAIYDVDWGYNAINDASYVYLYQNGVKYELYSLRHHPATPALQLYFKDATTQISLNPAKGDMVVMEGGLRMNTGKPVYSVGDGVIWQYDGSNWVQYTPATDATVTNQEQLNEVKIDASVKMEFAFAENTVSYATFTSSNEGIATVDNFGNVTGIAEGTTTITATFLGFTKQITVTVIGQAQATSIVAVVANDIFNEDGALVAYVGEELNKEALAQVIKVKYGYDDGTYSKLYEITADQISVEGYDNTKAGTSKITVTIDNLSAELNVNVYTVTAMTAPSAASVSFWATLQSINFSLNADLERVHTYLEKDVLTTLGQYDKVTLRSAAKNGNTNFELNNIDIQYQRDLVMSFTNKSKTDMEIGDVLTVKAGFRFYKKVGTAYVATYELQQDAVFVWTGAEFANYTADANEVVLEETAIILPVGGYYKLPYTVQPAGSYVKAFITSSNEECISVSADGTAINVLKASEETVTVTIQLGDDETTAKTIAVTIRELEVVGYAIYEEREYNVSQGYDIALYYYERSGADQTPIKAVEVYENGATGVPFELNTENAVITGYDKTKAGKQNVVLTVTYNNKSFDTTMRVSVKEDVAQVTGNLMLDPFGASATSMYIDMNQTSANKINIPANIVEQYDVASYVKLVRGETEYEVEVSFNGQFFILKAKELSNYENGDRFIISAGCPVLAWTGSAVNYQPTSIGDYVISGTFKYEVVLDCNDIATKSWNTFVEYVGMEIASDKIEIGYGKLKDLGATLVPAYATVGEFELESADTSIVSINSTGLLKGEKIGSTTVTIKLSGGKNGEITRVVTVTVVDSKESINFGDEIVYVPTGTVSLTGQVLKDLGVSGKYVWSSGKTEGEVNLVNAKIIGYNANTKGEQTITVRVTEDGVTTTGKITVVIGKAPKSCSVNLLTASMIAMLTTLLATAVVLVKKH